MLFRSHVKFLSKNCAKVIPEELGNPLFHSYYLRNTHGTIFAEKGAQPKTIIEHLEDREIQTAMPPYVFNIGMSVFPTPQKSVGKTTVLIRNILIILYTIKDITPIIKLLYIIPI